ncbi:alpha/beta hydrolase [Qipengyuania sp. ASV99]|uniref:alpha/beta hydrolase n=1 Tax=Qipengyuania sp. ASV99 TaxID=3399681 RepID=UPI003A4C8089
MSEHDYRALRSTPDDNLCSARPGEIAAELAELDRKVGWLIINRYTYRLMRMLGRIGAPEWDASGLSIDLDPELCAGTIMVSPDERSGSGALVLIHGGGYVIGSPQDILPKAAFFARQLGVPVICAGYRLSPEARFPAPLDDCHASWHAVLARSGDLNIDPGKIAIAGYSAGGGLAANLIHRLHDEGGVQPAAQVLVYPMLDDRTATRRELDKPRHRVWSNRNNLFGWASFLGQQPGQDCPDYAVAARRNNLTGLPPAWLGVGTCDLFLDEDRDYAQRLIAANVETIYAEVDGAIHGFDMGGTPLGNAFVQSQVAFLKRFVV